MNLKSFRVRLNSNSKLIQIACSFFLILPSLLLLYYVSRFGVNIIVLDEWGMVPLFQKSMNGTLTFSDLFSQHNEHRILFPRIIILFIGGITQYNTIAENFLSWVLLCLSGLLIFKAYRMYSCTSRLNLLAFLPVSLLLFSFRQYWSMLFGISGIAHKLMLFGLVSTFFLLEKSKKIDAWFILSLLSAILASFSFLPGLLVWPVGFLQLMFSERKKKLKKATLWCFLGLSILIFYFYDWVKPRAHPSLYYVLEQPFGGLNYLLAIVGAPLTFDLATAKAFGLILMSITLFVIIVGLKENLLKKNGIWTSFMLFGILAVLITTIGRAGFGLERAMASRFTDMAILGIIGFYLLSLCIFKRSSVKHKGFGIYALLILIIAGSLFSYSNGWVQGESLKHKREVGTYILKTYEVQSDENLEKYIFFPSAAYVRKWAKFLEEKRLNVFSEKIIDISTLNHVKNKTSFYIDTINKKRISSSTSPIIIDSKQQETIIITGWAVDRKANDSASGVFINIDKEIDIPAYYGIDRPDVSKKYSNPNFRFSGYMATFSSTYLEKGRHSLSIKIITRDGEGYYHPEKSVDFIIK